MRDFKGMKRQRGRNRMGGGGGGGGGGKPQHNANRAFDSNGPEGVKVRGAAQHVYEKYQQLARDAHTAGDRVLAENNLQHAEHYFRVMRAMQPQRPLAEIIGRDQFVSGYDIDFEDESGSGEAAELETELTAHGAQTTERNDFQQGESRPRDERPASDRYASQNERQGRNGRDDRPKYNRDERPRYERQDRDAPTRATDGQNGGEREEPGRAEPRTDFSVEPSANSHPASVLRADDGEINHAPAFLQVRPVEPRNEVSDENRPRRRRAPRVPEGSETPDIGES